MCRHNWSRVFALKVLALSFVVSAFAQEEMSLRPIRRLNTAPFYSGVQGQTELVQVINRYAEDIRTGLAMAGLPQLADPVIGEIQAGRLTAEELPFGQKFHFMLFRHTVSGRDQDTGRKFKRGEVDVVRNLYWASDTPVQAYVLRVDVQSKQYTFAIPFGPKGCTNLSLISVKSYPVCQLVIRPKPAQAGVPVTIDASGSYAPSGVVSLDVTITDASGSAIASKDGSRPFEWTCPSPGNYAVRTIVTSDGLQADCSEKLRCVEPPPPPNEPPRCTLIVSPEQAVGGQTITIDATGASDPEECVKANTLEIKDQTGQLLLSSPGDEVLFHKFKRRGLYSISNTVTDCKGEIAYCKKTVEVTRKRGTFSVAVGGLFEKRLGSESFSELFDIGLIVETDPWPNVPFVRATIMQLNTPGNAASISYSIKLYSVDGGRALIGESSGSTVFEMMLPGSGSYEVVARGETLVNGGTASDEESIAFTVQSGTTDSFNVNDQSTTVVSEREKKEKNWYIPVKIGYAYELVSNLEAAIYGGVAISVDKLDDSVLFGDLQLNLNKDPILIGIGLGSWDITDRSVVELLVNAGVIVGRGVFGSEIWTLFLQGRLPFDKLDKLSDEFRVMFGIRIDF